MHLFIDTHLNDVVIALYENNILSKIKILENVTENSKIIMPNIREILEERVPNSLIVVNGPGSFTGVRLGVTIAKTFAYTLKKPIRVITSLEAMAVSFDGEDKVVSFSDNNGYYVGFFTKDNEQYGEYQYLNNNEYKEFTAKYEVKESVPFDYKKIIEYALTKNTINAHEVNPIYIKKIDVEK